jgi:hypothetical protein
LSDSSFDFETDDLRRSDKQLTTENRNKNEN